MKRTLRLAAGLAAVLLFPFLFSGCPQLVTVSIEDRIDMFLTDLNTDSSRTDIDKNLHPDIQNPWKAPEAVVRRRQTSTSRSSRYCLKRG